MYEVYDAASVKYEWSLEQDTCDQCGIDFFSTPYSLEAISELDPFVPAYKIGSGDITWLDFIEAVALKNKPYILASGASSLAEVEQAVKTGLKINKNLCLMQCNTNYTASNDNFKSINLNVLKTFSLLFPEVLLGLSDHTPGHSTVLGAIALGARMIEKHFTDDNERTGPDHKFSMNPSSWKEMIQRSGELVDALGVTTKEVQPNEASTVVLQRRSIRLTRHVPKGDLFVNSDFSFYVRSDDALELNKFDTIVGSIGKKI